MSSAQDHPNYSLTKFNERRYSDGATVNPLPRAVIRPNCLVLLDGDWKFAHDEANVGLQERWYLGHSYPGHASWPGSVETHLQADENKDRRWHNQVIAWYEREFPMPEMEGLEAPSLLQLTFGACGYETRVWLNGYPLATIEGEYIHTGEYTSFSYELDEKVLHDNNRLTIRVMSTMDADTPRGKQESSVYKRGGIWYQTYTGGVRSIWLEMVEKNRLRSRVGAIGLIETNLVRFNLTTRIHDPGHYIIRLKVYHKNQDSEEPVAVDKYPLVLEDGQKQQRLVIEIPDARRWSLESPHLYRLVAQLIDENGYTAEIESQFGLRKIEARGSMVYLNNKPVYLNGIL